MAVFVFSEAAAATAVGSSIAAGKPGQQDVVPRIIRRVAVVGSAAAGDCAFDLYAGNTYLGRYYNTSTGTVPLEAKDWQPGPDMGVDAGELFDVRVADASGTNVANVHVDFEAV